MIVYKTTYAANDDAYYVCEQCHAIKPGRTEQKPEGKMVRPPIGWISPRRSNTTINPNVVSDVYCCFDCFWKHEGLDDRVGQPIEEPQQIEVIEPQIAQRLELQRTFEQPPATLAEALRGR